MKKNPCSPYGLSRHYYGIIQGGSFRDLREQVQNSYYSKTVDGIAIGGESHWFDMPKTCEIIDWVRPMLPEDKIRYTMGVGLTRKI